MNVKVVLFHVLAFAIVFLSPYILALSHANPVLTFLFSLGIFVTLLYMLYRRMCLKAEKWRIVSLILSCLLVILGFYIALRGVGFAITWGLWQEPEYSYMYTTEEELEMYRQWAWKEMIYYCYTKEGIPEWFVYVDVAGIPIGIVLLSVGMLTSLKAIWKIEVAKGLAIVMCSLILGAVVATIIFDKTPCCLTIIGMRIPYAYEFLIPIIPIGIFFSLNTTLGAIFHLIDKQRNSSKI
ncbi:MAG: hypothetical protein QXR45_16210 [Candidatus Bathyarchaeia archaeon]